MRAFIEGRIVDFSDVSDLAKSVIFNKMYEEGAKSMTAYMEGWVETMDEIEGQDDENHTPYTIESVMSVAVDTIDNEVGTVRGNVAQLGESPKGFYEAVEKTINEMLREEA
jgi:hypothetical protein